MRKKWFRIAAALTAALLAGCTEVRLADGKYTTALSGRDDFAAVYGDLIFLRLRNAEDDTMDNGYWDWAGKYRIEDGSLIKLEMDRKTGRDWNFYYRLTMRGHAIVVEDLRADNSYTLQLRPAEPKRPAAGPGTSTGTAYPAYR
ncbi:MAG: hypothetical protein MR051_07045 [Lentisphaeria bacterium]|nr:hypothetical protein [Lentisphaeria bacterium]